MKLTEDLNGCNERRLYVFFLKNWPIQFLFHSLHNFRHFGKRCVNYLTKLSVHFASIITFIKAFTKEISFEIIWEPFLWNLSFYNSYNFIAVNNMNMGKIHYLGKIGRTEMPLHWILLVSDFSKTISFNFFQMYLQFYIVGNIFPINFN